MPTYRIGTRVWFATYPGDQSGTIVSIITPSRYLIESDRDQSCAIYHVREFRPVYAVTVKEHS